MNRRGIVPRHSESALARRFPLTDGNAHQ